MTRHITGLGLLATLALILGCVTGPSAPVEETIETAESLPPELAQVVSVQVSGESGLYYFSVGIQSPDRGCDQYADWWEIVDEQGSLIYRRILLHSHVEEQPFVRSGGPVQVKPDAVLWVRAHMHPGGYGGEAFKGSVRKGFQPATLDRSFAAGLADAPPLPDSCAF